MNIRGRKLQKDGAICIIRRFIIRIKCKLPSKYNLGRDGKIILKCILEVQVVRM